MGQEKNGGGKEKKLTIKQTLFCYHYVRIRNATKAAIKAGYSEKTARQMGAENLAKPVIQAEIQRLMREHVMGEDEVLARLGQLGRASIDDFVDIKDGKPVVNLEKADQLYQNQAIKRLKISDTYPVDEDGPVKITDIDIELYDPKRPLETTAKHLGLLDDTLVVKVEKEIDVMLDALELALDPETFDKVLAVISANS